VPFCKVDNSSFKINKKGNYVTFIIGLISIIKLVLDSLEYKLLIDETINGISNIFATLGAIVGVILNHQLRLPRK
jgi:hypothetical protein